MGVWEVIWKVMEAIIYTLIKKPVTLYDVLCEFCLGRGTGTSIMELNLAQDLASLDQKPLFLVLLDLRKSYDNLDCGWIFNTLEGYGAGPKTQGILTEFWVQQEVVTRKNGYHGPQFRSTRGTTQGVLTFTTLFNVVVKNVARHCLSMTVDYNTVIHNGMGHSVGRSM